MTRVGTRAIRLTAPPSFTGTIQVRYEIRDTDDMRDTGTYTVNITAPVNEAPSARDDSATTNQGSAIDIPVLNNDEDPDGDQLTVEPMATPSSQQGVAAVLADRKTVRFTPAAGFSGQATFQYRAVDGNGTKSNTATVRVNVIACAQATPVVADTSTLTPVRRVDRAAPARAGPARLLSRYHECAGRAGRRWRITRH